jgi:large subunit ribosomal protein L30
VAGKSKAAHGAKLRVTWVRSGIGHNPATRGTVRALGLHRLHQTVEMSDTPANRGMIRRVAFLLDVREEEGGKATTPNTTDPTAEAAPEETPD